MYSHNDNQPRLCHIHQQRQYRARPKLQLVRHKLNELVVSMEKTKLAQTSDESTKRLKTSDNMDTSDCSPLITTAKSDQTSTASMSDAKSQSPFGGQQ